MMNQIKMYIKNFIKIKLFIFILSCLAIMQAGGQPSNSNNEIENKKKSFKSIDLEIQELEDDLKFQIQNQKESKNKIIELQSEIESKKFERINTKREKGGKQEYLIRSNGKSLLALYTFPKSIKSSIFFRYAGLAFLKYTYFPSEDILLNKSLLII